MSSIFSPASFFTFPNPAHERPQRWTNAVSKSSVTNGAQGDAPVPAFADMRGYVRGHAPHPCATTVQGVFHSGCDSNTLRSNNFPIIPLLSFTIFHGISNRLIKQGDALNHHCGVEMGFHIFTATRSFRMALPLRV